MKSTKILQIWLLVASVVVVVTAQQQQQQQEVQKETKKDARAGKLYREQEPHFKPPPLPVRRKLQVFSGAEHPPSFFQEQIAKAESRQFEVQSLLDQQQPVNFQREFQPAAPPTPDQFQQRQQFDPNQFQQFNQAPGQPQQQQFGGQNPSQQPNFQSFSDFSARQQENLPTLPPVFIPPNQPQGPPPQLQSPIRNLFREPEPSFSLAGLLQRFLRLFNLGNN